VSHIRRGRGFRRLNEIATHRLGQEVFETHRWIHREKGYDVSVVVGRFDPIDGVRKSDNDPSCALCDCRVDVGTIGLPKPL
jgi:hypothetical protein